MNSVVEIIEGFVLFCAGLCVVSILWVDVVLTTLVWKVGVDWCRSSSIPFRWLALVSGDNCGSSIVTWLSL